MEDIFRRFHRTLTISNGRFDAKYPLSHPVLWIFTTCFLSPTLTNSFISPLLDLPRNLWYLIQEPIFSVGVLGLVLASYLPAGYVATLPGYIRLQFAEGILPPEVLTGSCLFKPRFLATALLLHMQCYILTFSYYILTFS